MSEDPKKYQLTLTNVRLSYPQVFKPKAMTDKQGRPMGEPKFSASFLMDKKEHKKLIAEIKTKIEQLKAEKNLKVAPDKVCLHDGVEKDGTDGYGEDVMYLNASNTRRPQVVDRKKGAVTEEDNVIYGGCYVNAVVRLWPQNNEYGKRINASLEAVQFVRDGEAFGAPPVDLDDALPDLDKDEDSPLD